MEYFSKHYHQNFSHNVTTLIDTTSRNSSYLAVFFITLLIAMSLIVNWAAKRTLITPLNHIKEAVRAFGRGQRSFPALEVMDSCDDIGELGEAIITMTKDLIKTTVSKDYVDSILHNMNDSLIVTSMNFHIRNVNLATLNLLGYDSDELIGRHINTIFRGPLNRVQDCDTFDNADKLDFHSSGKNEKSFYSKDGQIIPVLLSTALLKNGDIENQGFVYVAKDITERKKTEEKLEQMALYDFLTGLANRVSFNDRLEQALRKARRQNSQTGLMFIDLDRFKEINDTLGHDSGDALLKKVAEWLQKSVRECDTVARLGGDEFAIILENINDHQDATNTADRILTAFTTPVRYDGKEFFTSPSIGIAVYPGDAAKAEDLLKYADLAMYQAKENGGNDYSFFSQKKNE
jgi:diguanylate cyclase (GGDEF)-like protein/PAS domain S-box-containing protein